MRPRSLMACAIAAGSMVLLAAIPLGARAQGHFTPSARLPDLDPPAPDPRTQPPDLAAQDATPETQALGAQASSHAPDMPAPGARTLSPPAPSTHRHTPSIATQVLGPRSPETGPGVQPIDIVTVLRLAGIRNLDLALIREAERQAKAANDAATLRFFPWLSVGQTYARRTGADQQTAGQMLEVDKQLYRRGATLGIGLDLGDAIFGKLAATQLRNAAALATEAQRDDTLLAAAQAYFNLVNLVAEVDIAREAVRVSQDYQDQLERAVAIGITNRSEALRVAVQTQQLQIQVQAAEAKERTGSAALSTVLRLDPAIVLVPRERLAVPPVLVPLDAAPQGLIRQALESRPEVGASTAAIAAAERQSEAARYGPLLPTINAITTYGRARGGVEGDLDPYQATHDVAVGLSWRIGPGGLLDFSRTEAADSRLARQRLGGEKVRQGISEQVIDALAVARAAHEQVLLARHGVELAQQSLKLSMQRKEFGVYAVLEVIQAQQDLTRARSSYATALADEAKGQYALARATGRIGS